MTRPTRLRGFTIAAVTACALAFGLLTACGGSTSTIDVSKVERAIAQSILKERGLTTLVACPSNEPLSSGTVFTCTAKLDVGLYPVTVTEVGGDGEVRYSDASPLVVLDTAKVQSAILASIRSQRHVTAAVRCPVQVLQRAGVRFRCIATVASSGRSYAFAVSELDGSGHVKFIGV